MEIAFTKHFLFEIDVSFLIDPLKCNSIQTAVCQNNLLQSKVDHKNVVQSCKYVGHFRGVKCEIIKLE